MSIFLNLVLLIALFAVLGMAADLAVKNIRLVALSLRMRMFALGIILGIMTTLPELSVGINATLEDAASLSVGNIMGGVVVLIGLILGSSLMLNRGLKTDDSLSSLVPASLVILSPFLLGVDGQFGLFDGIIMVALYIGLIFYLYRINRAPLDLGGGIAIVDKRRIVKEIFFAIVGIIIVMLASHFIIELTLMLLEKVAVSRLMVGLLLFSIGTNLPEITITLTSWRRKTSDLSLSHLISSSFTNILVLGLLAIMSPITFTIGPVYYALAFFVCLIVTLFLVFSHSDKRLSRLEGMILLIIYILFVATNIYLVSR